MDELVRQSPASLGDWLLAQKLVTSAQLQLAEREASRQNLPLVEVMARLGLATDAELASYRAHRGSVRTAIEFLGGGQQQELGLRRLALPDDLRTLFPEKLCTLHDVIPVARKEGVLWVAMANPFDLPTLRKLEQIAGMTVEPLPGAVSDLRLAISRNYSSRDELHTAVGEFLRMDQALLHRQAQDDPPMIRLAQQLLLHAAVREASDVHIHPEQRFLRVRLRVDGMLEEGLLLPAGIRVALTARFKILAGMDVAEDRLPQDGRIEFEVGGQSIDVRVSTLPSCHGESLVMRLLDRSRVRLDLNYLGFSGQHQVELSSVIARPHGVFLVTGPTGSGKTTTLYTLLGMIDAEARSVFTLEDPIEYRLPLVRQTQVREDIGLTFSAGLRTLLRQDPDVILVGETRDRETAELMIRAALTGHLVLSTLHTNDALGAVPRLADLGVPHYLLAGCLLGVSAQRLVRRLCSVCREPYAPDPTHWRAVAGEEIPPARLFRPAGCPACAQAGYRGRLSITEILLVDTAFSALVERQASRSEMKALIRSRGVPLMRDDGLAKACEGLTTPEEISRVTSLSLED